MSLYALAMVCGNIWWGVKVEVTNESLSVLRRAAVAATSHPTMKMYPLTVLSFRNHLSLNLDQEVYILRVANDVWEHPVDPWLRPAPSVIVATPVKLCIPARCLCSLQ